MKIRLREIKFRVSEEEYALLQGRCTRGRMATWVREVCLAEKERAVSQVKVLPPELLRQLAGIGNNLNQLARKVNSIRLSSLDKSPLLIALLSIERELQRVKGVSHDS